MALNPATMLATMLARAIGAGLIDRPPNFGLSRTYKVMAEGVVKTLLDPSATLITVNYGPGQPSIPPLSGVSGPVLAWDGLDPDGYAIATQLTSGFIGPPAQPFFVGVAGIVEHVAALVAMTDIFAPTGNGVGLLSPGGVLFDADSCFDNMKDEAISEKIMTVQLGVQLETPLDTIADPTTGVELGLDDLFVQAEILLRSVSTQLALELLSATKAGIPVVGGFDPLAPPIVALSVTSFLL